jgi:hypothetical protein
MIQSSMHPDLADLLRRRLTVISDHAWRDRDSNGHLGALKEVSEEISAWTTANRSQIDPQLRHFLANCSFDKALAHISGA